MDTTTAVNTPAAPSAASKVDAPVAAPTRSLLEKVEAAVEGWFDEHVRNSPIAREEAAYAHAFAAKLELKKRLLAEL